MTCIGRYQIRKELGRGAMGIVYLADDPLIGRQVAIKTIRLDQLSRPADECILRRRIFREAQSAGQLSHPHIVAIYDFAEVDGVARIVMEYLAGKTLHRLMQWQPRTRAQTLKLLEQIALALDYAHSRGVLHCDIKPENLIVSREGILKVMDFGIARIISEATSLNGMIVGTPSYMSPEQVLGQPLTGATDQYSMAVIAFELLAGAKPHEASSAPELLHRIACEEPAFQRLGPNTPPRAAEILRKALAKDPAARYRTCKEVFDALRAACNERPNPEPLPAPASRRKEPSAACPPPRRLWVAAGACIILLLACLLVAYASRPREPRPAGFQPVTKGESRCAVNRGSDLQGRQRKKA
jgi:serine/threonine protein kinase